jgi:hypothetical protein
MEILTRGRKAMPKTNPTRICLDQLVAYKSWEEKGREVRHTHRERERKREIKTVRENEREGRRAHSIKKNKAIEKTKIKTLQ